VRSVAAESLCAAAASVTFSGRIDWSMGLADASRSRLVTVGG